MAQKKISKKSASFSNSKGKRFEREVSHLLKEAFNCEARRGQQYSGASGDHDVKTDLQLAIECKRVESLNLSAAYEQAKADALPGEKPVVIHKKNHKPIMITMSFDDWIETIGTLNSRLKP